MDTHNCYDNSYLNSMVTNLSSDIITINEKLDCVGTTIHSKFDSLFSGILLDSHDINILINNLIINILQLGTDFRRTISYISDEYSINFSLTWFVGENRINIIINNEKIIYNDLEYSIEELMEAPLFERDLLLNIRKDLRYLIKLNN